MIAGVLIVMERTPMGFGIRWTTQSGDEGRGYANHNADWFLDDEGREFLIHSVPSGTKEVDDWPAEYDNAKCWGVIAVPLGHTQDEHWAVLTKARDYLEEDTSYDWAAISKHFVDGIAGKVLGRPVYAARYLRLKFWERPSRYNICSWLASWTWAAVKHAVIGMIRGKLGLIWRGIVPYPKRRLWKGELDPRLVAPNDWERAVFLHDRAGYRIVREFGRRPPDLPIHYIHKIASDLALGLDGVVAAG